MNKSLKYALAALGFVLALLLGFGMYVSHLLSGENLTKLVNEMSARLPVKLEVGAASFDFGEWLKLQPAVKIENFRVLNPPGFQSPTVMAGKSLRVKVALKPLLDRRLEIQEVELIEPAIDIERDKAGRTNLQAIQEAAAAKAAKQKASPSGGEAAGTVTVQSLVLSDGIVRFRDQAGKGLGTGTMLSRINLKATDLDLSKASSLELSGNLLGLAKSTIEFRGQGGPYKAEGIPVKGRLEIRLSPGEATPEIKKMMYSSWLREPGEASRVDWNLDLGGDLLGQLKGEGDLMLKGFQIGKEKGKTMPLEGTARFRLAVSNLTAGSPAWALATDGARLNLGKGSWNGSLSAAGAGPRVEARSAGSVQGVAINEFLGVFSPSSAGLVYGTLVMPKYQLSAAGSTPEQIEASIQGSGHMDVNDGRIPKMDILAKIQNAVGSATGGPAGDDTNFNKMGLDFTIANRRVNLSNMLLTGPGLKITGGGTVTFDQALDLKLNAEVSGGIGAALGKLDQSGQSALNVPTTVTGNAGNPVVKVQVKSMVVERGVSAATSVLDKFLGGRKKK